MTSADTFGIDDYRRLCSDLLYAGPSQAVLRILCKACGKSIAVVERTLSGRLVFVGQGWAPDVWRGGLEEVWRPELFGSAAPGRLNHNPQQFLVLLGHTFRHPSARLIGDCRTHGLVELDRTIVDQWARTAQRGGSTTRRVRCGTLRPHNVWPQSTTTEAR